MLNGLLLLTLAASAPSTDAAPSTSNAWSIVTKGDMLTGQMIYDELGNSWNIDGHLIWGQVYLSGAEVSIDIAARGCLEDATDYRQKVTFPRAAKETEVATLRISTLKLIGVVQQQCSLASSTTDTLMNGLEAAFRDLYEKSKNARHEAQ